MDQLIVLKTGLVAGCKQYGKPRSRMKQHWQWTDCYACFVAWVTFISCQACVNEALTVWSLPAMQDSVF